MSEQLQETVEPGQVWKDNDTRSKGEGEFTVIAVVHQDGTIEHLGAEIDPKVMQVIRNGKAGRPLPLEPFAVARRDYGEKIRYNRIRVWRMITQQRARTGYTYVGRAR